MAASTNHPQVVGIEVPRLSVLRILGYTSTQLLLFNDVLRLTTAEVLEVLGFDERNLLPDPRFEGDKEIWRYKFLNPDGSLFADMTFTLTTKWSEELERWYLDLACKHTRGKLTLDDLVSLIR